ncbi:Vitamin B12 import ATP-binding protein BtuD [Candidatus Entotheonellaceae bacterium PAL068K]
MYTLTGVGKTYANGFTALQNIHFRITTGERVALIGPSGAGKTSLFRLLNCTLRPSTGTLGLGDVDSSQLYGKHLRRLRRSIGTIYQQHNLIPRLRVMHNVLAGHLGRWSVWRSLLSLLRPIDLDSAALALQQVGLADKIFQRTDRLSGGEQQRVAIARVLVQNPTTILADEPVASLDPALSETIVRLLLDLSIRGRRTLLVSLHNVQLALDYFPRILALQHGRLVFDGAPQALSSADLQDLFVAPPSSSDPEADT